MLTAAVRDLKHAFPTLELDVRTPCSFLWKNNPYLTPLAEKDALVVPLGYKTPHQRGEKHPTEHFIYAFHASLEEIFGISFPKGDSFPDIWLDSEDNLPVLQTDKPILLVNAGSKADFPVKQWPIIYFQAVVDVCKDHYEVVQIGETVHGKHPKLENVINLVDKTPGRALIRLFKQAAAVLTGVSYPMHLCAALNAADGLKRRCVVLAGNREAEIWEKYPEMAYLTSSCSYFEDKLGCWRRYLPQDTKKLDEFCKKPVRMPDSHYYAGCMTTILPERVIECLL